jgi:hypothetical protein
MREVEAAFAGEPPIVIGPSADQDLAMLLRALRYFAAALAIVISGWFLLGYYGLPTAYDTVAAGRFLCDLPQRPVMELVIDLGLALAFPFLSAWRMKPVAAQNSFAEPGVQTLWQSYPVRLVLAFAAAFLAAYFFAFLEMARFDSGVISRRRGVGLLHRISLQV